MKYGLTKPLEKETPGTIVFHEWQSIWKDMGRKDIGWKEKWNYLFGPPGWSHDGSRLTSEELREMEEGNFEKKESEAIPDIVPYQTVRERNPNG